MTEDKIKKEWESFVAWIYKAHQIIEWRPNLSSVLLWEEYKKDKGRESENIHK